MERVDDLPNDCRLEGYNLELAIRRVAFPDCGTYSSERQIDACVAAAPTLTW